jgi:hypothetical protein
MRLWYILMNIHLKRIKVQTESTVDCEEWYNPTALQNNGPAAQELTCFQPISTTITSSSSMGYQSLF